MTLGTFGPVYLTDRQMRKQLVFHIMYGWHRDAKETEMLAWRTMAADFIDGQRDDVPLSLEAFRSYMETPPPPLKNFCPCQGDCIVDRSSEPDEMRLCPHFDS